MLLTQLDKQVYVLSDLFRGPVADTLLLSFLLWLTQHQDGSNAMLPDHAPEVIDCAFHGTLGHNVLMATLVSLQGEESAGV